MNATMQDTIEREILIRAPKERVYAAISQPDKIVAWFPESVEGKLEAGERAIFNFGEYGKSSIAVVAADPHSYFAYRWLPGCSYEEKDFTDDVLARANTLVEFRLEDAPEGTRVRLLESGFASLPAEYYEASIKDNNEGWDYMLKRLENLFQES